MADNCSRWVNVLPTASSFSSKKRKEGRRYLRRRILTACNSVNSNYSDDDGVVNVCSGNSDQLCKLTAASLQSSRIKYKSTASLEFVVTVVLHVLVVAWLNIYLFSLLPVGAAGVPSRVPTPVQDGQIETSRSAPVKENSNNFQFVQWLLKHKADHLSQTCPKFGSLSTKIAVASKCSEQGCGNAGVEQEGPQQLEFTNKVHSPTPTSNFKGDNPYHVESATGASGVRDPPENVGSAAQLHQGTDKSERLDLEHSSNILSKQADAMHSGHPELTLQAKGPMQDHGEGESVTHAAPVVVSQVLSTKMAGLKSLSHSVTIDSNLNAMSSNIKSVEVSLTEELVSSRKSDGNLLTTTETDDGVMSTHGTSDTHVSLKKQTGPQGSVSTTIAHDLPTNFAETLDGTSTTTETPDGASTTAETPDGASTTTETPDGASTITETPDGASTTTETPDGTSTTTETPDGPSTTTETPDGASTITETPDGASTTTETPDGASTTTETPDGVSTITETPDGASTTTTETPDGASTTTETPDGASATTGTPNGASAMTETPDGASATNGTPDGATVTMETPDGASTTTETPDGASTTTEAPDGTSTTTETPDGASATTGTPDGASTTTETPDGASTTTETLDGASTTTETPDGAPTTAETPDGALFHPVPTMDGVDLSVHDMPDFANWRKEFYGNDTKHGGVVLKDRAVEVSEGKVAISSSPVRLNNYASHECGAKVISSNKEADNLQAVLNENKDQYIIQPCSAKKWLVIELCESVLIREIQIGNLELFSSIFENFTVSISQTKGGGGKDRPGKDWLPVGSFQGKEERAMQTFIIDQLELYTTFVKVEVLTHYGNEHYCPITIIRVHGASFNDDDDDDETINSGLDLEKEPELPCTEPPPPEDLSRDVGASFEFVFPPQPAECFLCYSSLKDVPEYCWPPYYHLLNNSTQAPSHTDSSDVDRPCDPSSTPDEPAKFSSSSVGAEAENNSTRETNDLDGDTVMVSSGSEATVPSKVQTTPVAAEVAVADGSTQEAATATITTSLGVVEEATPTPVESIEPTATAGPADEILPSPPTLAQPPTAAPTDEGPMEQQSKNEQDKDLTDPPVEQSEPPPPPAMRSVKKNSAIGSVKNQVKSLERSLQVTNRYLEEMSKKSKNQKEDLQRALNQTMKLLHNTTLRLEAMIKNYEALKVTAQQLSKQVEILEEHVSHNKMHWLTPVVSICTLLLTIILSQCLSSYRQLAVNRQQVEQILETLPESPVRRLKRRGSTSELANSVPQEDNRMKRANSCISFESSETSQLVKSTDKLSPGSRKDLPVKVGDNSADPAVPIEIISPTTWRTFNTPDGKAGKRRKKTLRGKQQLLGTSNSAPIPEETDLPKASLMEGVTRQADGRTARPSTS